ncbi:hypothetical protein B0T21DRAFT_298847 [Apiosordaria backusii]|uniref:BZIP domain-containing protein n=1 Tax=Apiosordaria backusii TaxID=314023 RepID=A0AA40A0R9_9PEZI|nr:hypothetical protein B0T21DRAFT_298847 [Apiosordaria backusii]
MESWSTHTQTHTPSPTIKFENSPNDSLLSTPSEMYPSLFGAESSPAPSAMPDSTSDVAMLASLAALTQVNAQSPAPETPSSTSATPEPEKKQAKKRKSWGQVLPEPKTNLPPRKRAKTEDEKEQRRVERVLRNRRAAQSSRERKRLEVEGLEKRNQELEAALAQAKQANEFLLEQLRNARLGVGAGPPEAFDVLRLSSQLSFSQPLFSSQDGHNTLAKPDSLPQLHNTQNNNTVDPAALTPISEVDEEHELPATVSTPVADSAPVVNASPDATQHPAEMLCQDLQCRSAEAPPSAWLENSQQQMHPALALYLQLQFLLTSTSALISLCQRPLMQIAMSLKAGFSLPPAPALLTTIIWLVTTPKPSSSRRPASTLTSTTSSPTTQTSPLATSSSRSNLPPARSQTRPSSSLRLRLLRKILTCSPILARPLMDATMEVLRLVSSEGFTVDRVVGGDASAAAAADGKEQLKQQSGRPATWPTGTPLPSKEILLTLLWVLKVEARRLEIRQQVSPKLGSNSCVPKTTTPPSINNQSRQFVLNVVPKRRTDALESGDQKRQCF